MNTLSERTYHKLKNQRGAAMIEFAIVLPILLLLFAGIAEFALAYYNKQVLTNASREGARAGIIYEVDSSGDKIIITEADIQKIVQNYSENRLWTFGESSPPTTSAPGVNTLAYPQELTVTVQFTHTFLMTSLLNILGGNFGPTLDLRAVTVMGME